MSARPHLVAAPVREGPRREPDVELRHTQELGTVRGPPGKRQACCPFVDFTYPVRVRYGEGLDSGLFVRCAEHKGGIPGAEGAEGEGRRGGGASGVGVSRGEKSV